MFVASISPLSPLSNPKDNSLPIPPASLVSSNLQSTENMLDATGISKASQTGSKRSRGLNINASQHVPKRRKNKKTQGEAALPSPPYQKAFTKHDKTKIKHRLTPKARRSQQAVNDISDQGYSAVVPLGLAPSKLRRSTSAATDPPIIVTAPEPSALAHARSKFGPALKVELVAAKRRHSTIQPWTEAAYGSSGLERLPVEVLRIIQAHLRTVSPEQIVLSLYHSLLTTFSLIPRIGMWRKGY
ncbi:hypothetical protein HBH98_219720 [Parastagonospora nodorum]|nr:hypothetical protein HBH47_213280 [Parastagonospora nodorum]KAH4153278.1 hypothetical protein HBH43_227060 [Parastagonospora nodorum]KAH4227709.1 hypothetical protein HBI05_209340 [Parastagonospora nodorum]KAH4251917.1 hypothetical protein HBI03_217660 [Parastagonospora nodorum]KAH4258721.1 hypothetical protein HBI04_215980 [Parastagonospora nodorum]